MTSISRLLSRNPSPETIKDAQKEEPHVLSIDDEAADDVFSTLSSETSRAVLSTLYDEPQTASEVAKAVNTSLQNVNYHLNNLIDCDLIEVVETWYSDQGKEMKVYAPTNKALVVFASDDLQRTSLLENVKGLIGFVGVFGILSIFVNYLVRELASSSGSAQLGTGGAGVETPLFAFPPGLLFFVGSLLALLSVAIWRYYSRPPSRAVG